MNLPQNSDEKWDDANFVAVTFNSSFTGESIHEPRDISGNFLAMEVFQMTRTRNKTNHLVIKVILKYQILRANENVRFYLKLYEKNLSNYSVL